VRWLAPILVFTAEEAFQHRHGGAAQSVHSGTYAPIDPAWRDPALDARMEAVLALRAHAFEGLESLRRDKAIGSFLAGSLRCIAGAGDHALLDGLDLAELLQVAEVELEKGAPAGRFEVRAGVTALARCDRCWRHLPDVAAASGLCIRCAGAVA